MLNSWKVRTRLFILLTVIVSALIITAVISTVNTRSLVTTLEISSQELFPAVTHVQRMETNIANINGLMAEVNLITNHDRIREIEREVTELLEENDTIHLPIVRQVLSSETALALYDTFVANMKDYKELHNTFFEIALNEENTSAIYSQIINKSEEITSNIEAFADFIITGTDSFIAADIQQAETANRLLLMISGTTMLLGIAVALLIIASIIKPINILKAKLSQLASGDLTIEVPTDYKAEFGEMFASFKKMIENVHTLIVETKGTSGEIQYSFVTVKEGVGEVRGLITEMESFLDELAIDTGSQMSGLKESAMTMDHIASGIQQMAESSAAVAELATETSSQASDGSEIIGKSVKQMETINQVVEDTSSVVDRLVKRTKTIDEALKAITAIAEQTNLLALNASIEAARAGEHGRGFAVVAEEVSKLADQSKGSAKEINTLLQEINEDTKEAVQAMEQGKMEAKQGIEVIHQAGEAFSSIVEQVTTMTEQVQEMSSAVEEMSAGTEEVNSSIADIVNSSEIISGQTTESTQKNHEQVETIRKIVNAMKTAQGPVEKLGTDLDRFKTDKEGTIG